MFLGASSFNQTLCWDASFVTQTDNIFVGIGGSFSTDMSCPTQQLMNNTITNGKMKRAAAPWVINNPAALSKYGDIALWDTSRVTNMDYLFGSYNPYGSYDWAADFNSDLAQWNTSSVTSILGMFNEARFFNSNLSLWDTSRVMNMNEMFYYAEVFNSDLSQWNTSQVTHFCTHKTSSKEEPSSKTPQKSSSKSP